MTMLRHSHQFTTTCCLLLLLLFSTGNVTAESSEDRILTVSTRFGDVIVSKDIADQCGCSGWIQFGSDKIKVGSAGTLYASNDGVFRMKEGDIVIISIPVGARGLPPQHYALLVKKEHLVDLTPESQDFVSEDGTFKVIRHGDEHCCLILASRRRPRLCPKLDVPHLDGRSRLRAV
jgi:hypothetical protein